MNKNKGCWFKRNIIGKIILLLSQIILFIPVVIILLGINLYRKVKRKK